MIGNKKVKFELRFSICMPIYNGGAVISPTIESILSQSFDNFELIVVNDRSTDNSGMVIKGYQDKDKRVKYYKNKVNLGYSRNVEECRKKAVGDVLYLMGQDDILGKDALLNTYKAFMKSPDIGAVTRPYFWFDKDIQVPVRTKMQLNSEKDEVVTINDDPAKIVVMLQTLDQLSGLAYRRKFMDLPFHKDVFPCHVYPFVSIFKKHPVVFLKDYNVAVRINTSQTRSLSSIYCKSPMRSWKEMFDNLLFEEKYKKLNIFLLKNFIAMNYVGLVQLRNYAELGIFLREVCYLVAYRKENLITFGFWFYVLGCLIIPPVLLIPLVDWYKNNINSNILKKMGINFNFFYETLK